LIKKITSDNLIKEIKDNQENWLSMENAKNFI